MHLYLIAPFHTCFGLKTSNFADDLQYKNFWNEAAQKLSVEDKETLMLLHASKQEQLRYKVIDQDSHLLKEDIVKFSQSAYMKRIIDDAILQADKQYLNHEQAGLIEYTADSACFTLLDNTVGMFEIQLKLSDKLPFSEQGFAGIIQHWTNNLCQLVVTSFFEKKIYPFIQKIIALDHKKLFIETEGAHYGFPNIKTKKSTANSFGRNTPVGDPLWVSRTVIQSPGEEIHVDFFNEWIFSKEDKKCIMERLRLFREDEKNSIYLGWGNNFFYACINNQAVNDAKRILLLTQYFYVILDTLSLNLSFIIGASKNIKKTSKCREYNATMNELVNTFSAIEIRFTDALQNLQGNREVFFRDLMEKWAFHELLGSIEKKADFCKRSINEQFQKSFKKGQMMAELLLLFLGGISLLEFTNTLIVYWFNIGIDDGIPGLYHLGKIFPPNALLWGAVFLLASFFFVYIRIYMRKSQ